MQLSIVPATPEDIPALLTLVNSAYRGNPSRKGWTTEADLLDGDKRTDEVDLSNLMSRGNATILKCRTAQNEIVGCVFLEKRLDRLYLGMLSVNPERQGSGIGKKLMRAAEELARKELCRYIFMRVLAPRKELIQWYERLGYVQTGETAPYTAPERFGVPQVPLEFLVLEKAV